ncbi:hypothetical protein AB0H83_34505 [Dactylosporangium sp. NPDC050688]|uniref:hypothetical protein n=1 Tax=Dactylosporangium sp. NPDC050688 TaxID=3157217 RepID=UPI0033E82AA2
MRKIVLTIAVAAAALSLSACDSIDLTKQGQATEAPAAAAAEQTSAAEPPAAATVAGVKVREDATLGKVVTDCRCGASRAGGRCWTSPSACSASCRCWSSGG